MFEVRYELRENWEAIQEDKETMTLYALVRNDIISVNEDIASLLMTITLCHFVYDLDAKRFVDKDVAGYILSGLIASGRGQVLMDEMEKIMKGRTFQEKDLNMSEGDLRNFFGLENNN